MASVTTTNTTISTTPVRKLGHVKFFNSTKGYGFIIPAEQLVETVAGQPPVEVFVHHTAIIGGGFKSLAEGEEVEYDLIQGPKGMQAANVSGPGGRAVQGDPNAHRPYHNHHHRYQNGHQHQHQPHHHHHQQQQQHHHHYGTGGGSMPEGMNNGHLGYTVYGMPYGYHPIYPAGPYMVPNGYYHQHHQFASSQSSPQLKPSIAMYYPYPPPAAAAAGPPPSTTATTPSQQPSYGILSNSSSSSSSNHTATSCEPDNVVEVSTSSC